MKKNKSVLNINKIAKKIDYMINEEDNITKKIEILRQNIKLLDSKVALKVLNKIIKRHEENLAKIVSKMEYYQLTDNTLSYRSSEIVFQKENDLLTRLKTEAAYFSIASREIDKMLKRYPKPVLSLSLKEQEILCELTKDPKLFNYNEFKELDKINRLDEIKIEIMLPLKQARRIIKNLRYKEKNDKVKLTLEEEEIKEYQENIKRLCNYFIQYINSIAVYEHYEMKKKQKENQKIIDEYILSEENKNKIKYFIDDDDNLMPKEDMVFCYKYILYKGDILEFLPLLYEKKDILFSKIDDDKINSTIKSFLDIIKIRKSFLKKDSIERNLLKDFEKNLKKDLRQLKKFEENEDEKWCRLFKLCRDKKYSANLLCESIKENPYGILKKYINKNYFEYILEQYFNFILNKSKGFSKEEEAKYNEQKEYFEKLLLTSLQELKNDVKADYLKINLEYYYNNFLRISEKNDIPIEHQKYVLGCLQSLLNILSVSIENNNKLKKDLSKHYIMTIDGDETRICEDAFSVLEKAGTYEFVVYVMDVVHLCPFDDELEDKYLANQRIMSKNQRKMLSLNQGRNKNVIAYIFELDKETLKPIDFRVQKDRIMINKNYTYTEFNQIISNLEDNKHKEKIESILKFLKQAKNLNQCKVKIDEAASILEALIIFFQNLYCDECEKNAYPVIYNEYDWVDEEHKGVVYSPYRTNNQRLSITSPIRKFDSYINQLLSIWYFVQNKIKTPNDLEKALNFVTEYVEILNSKERNKQKTL